MELRNEKGIEKRDKERKKRKMKQMKKFRKIFYLKKKVFSKTKIYIYKRSKRKERKIKKRK